MTPLRLERGALAALRRIVGVIVALVVALGAVSPALACRTAQPCHCKPAPIESVCAPDCCVEQKTTDTALKPTPLPDLVVAVLHVEATSPSAFAPASIVAPKRSAHVCLRERARPRLPLRI